MAGNNSCGGRFAALRHHARQHAVDGRPLADGTPLHFGEVPRDLSRTNAPDGGSALFRDMLDLGARERPRSRTNSEVQRRVGGYNLDALCRAMRPTNVAHLLVGSEGTLAFTTQVELKLWPIIRNKALGVCHFGSFYQAMDAAQHLVKLRPIAVELVDRTMIALGPRHRDVQACHISRRARRSRMQFSRRRKFAEEDQAENLNRLKQPQRI